MPSTWKNLPPCFYLTTITVVENSVFMFLLLDGSPAHQSKVTFLRSHDNPHGYLSQNTSLWCILSNPLGHKLLQGRNYVLFLFL